MKIYAGLSGLYGDAIMSTRLHEELRLKYPKAEIVGGIAKQFSSILPLLKRNPYVNRWVIWEGYCETFPSQKDQEFIDNEKFDLRFHPNPGHSRGDWFNNHHQVAELFLRYNLTPPENLKINFPKWPKVHHNNIVGFCPFANNAKGCKSLSLEKANEIIYFLNTQGYFVYHLGGKGEPETNAFIPSEPNWLDTGDFLCSCKFLITTDSACSWLASAFSTRVLGLYASNYYNGSKNTLNWQPINENAKYLEAPNANDIPNELIFKEISKLCQ